MTGAKQSLNIPNQSINTRMKLKLVRHLWGVDPTHGLDHYLPRWRDLGYEALDLENQIGVPMECQ